MYNFKINNEDLPVIIYGWKIPKNAVYSTNPEDPFVCLYPSPSSYSSHIWRYMKSNPIGWQHNTESSKTKNQLHDFIVRNHLKSPCSFDEGLLPPWIDQNFYDNIQINNDGSRVVMHGWEIPQNAVYNAGSKTPFVCLCPSPDFYKSNIWYYKRSGSKPHGWTKDNIPQKIKDSLFVFIVRNHMNCTQPFDGHPIISYDKSYKIKINKSRTPVTIRGYVIPQNAIYNADPKQPFVCIHPNIRNYETGIWWYNKAKNKWQHNKVPMQIKAAVYDFIVNNHLNVARAGSGSFPVHVNKEHKSILDEEKKAKICIICGKPAFMGTEYCYDCYRTYVEKPKA